MNRKKKSIFDKNTHYNMMKYIEYGDATLRSHFVSNIHSKDNLTLYK